MTVLYKRITQRTFIFLCWWLWNVFTFASLAGSQAIPSQQMRQPSLMLAPEPKLRQYVHRGWRSEDGLTQNSVNTVLQTSDGYLWIGTEEGLVRFNSTQFTTFSKANTPVMKAQDIRALSGLRQKLCQQPS